MLRNVDQRDMETKCSQSVHSHLCAGCYIEFVSGLQLLRNEVQLQLTCIQRQTVLHLPVHIKQSGIKGRHASSLTQMQDRLLGRRDLQAVHMGWRLPPRYLR